MLRGSIFLVFKPSEKKEYKLTLCKLLENN